MKKQFIIFTFFIMGGAATMLAHHKARSYYNEELARKRCKAYCSRGASKRGPAYFRICMHNCIIKKCKEACIRKYPATGKQKWENGVLQIECQKKCTCSD